MRDEVFEEDKSWNWDAADSNQPKSNKIIDVVYSYVEKVEKRANIGEPGSPTAHGGNVEGRAKEREPSLHRLQLSVPGAATVEEIGGNSIVAENTPEEALHTINLVRRRGLICLKRIYNFLCSMLVYTPFALCFLTLRGGFMHFLELTY
jgi:hypothetical protein